MLYSLLLVEERLEALVGHVDIELGDNLKRCVHGEHRHTDVEHVDIEVRDELCDRAAAALIDLAELADLPKHACIVKRAADFGDELCVRVGRTALAVCAGVLGYAQTAIDVGGVLCLVNGSIMRIICRGDVGGNAGGLGEHVARLFALCARSAMK